MKRIFLIFIFTLFFFGLFSFSGTNYSVIAADECDLEDSAYKPYDKCRSINFKHGSEEAGDDVEYYCEYESNTLHYFDDYNYEGSNSHCILMTSLVSAAVAAGWVAITPACEGLSSLIPSSNTIVQGLTLAGGAGLRFLTDPRVSTPIELGVMSAYATFQTTKQCAKALGCFVGACGQAVVLCFSCPGVMAGTWITVYGVMEGFNIEANVRANKAYKNVRVCGHDWNVWYSESGEYPAKSSVTGSGSHKAKVVDCIMEGGLCNHFSDEDVCDVDFFGNGCNSIKADSLNFKNKTYREFFYDGKEYINKNIEEGCIDPRLPEFKGYGGLEQRYYLKGYDAGNYACTRFNYKGQGCALEGDVVYTNQDVRSDIQKYKKCKNAFEDAYDCCIVRSGTSICIEDTSNSNSTFCQKKEGSDESKCSLSDVKFEPYKSIKDPARKLCIRSYDTCPFNFNVAGGTEREQLYCGGEYKNCSGDDEEAVWGEGGMGGGRPTSAYGQRKNFCRYNAHCTILPLEPYIYTPKALSKFIDPACRNFVGDSRNMVDLSIADDAFSILDLMNEVTDIFNTYIIADQQDEFAIDTRNLFIIEAVEIFIEGAKFTHENALKPLVELFGMEYDSELQQRLQDNWDEISVRLENLKEQYDGGNIFLDSVVDIGKYRGFTAPVAQCIKESMSNLFKNVAGSAKCADEDVEINEFGLCGFDTPDSNPKLESYEYLPGDKLPENENIFYKIQNRVRDLIKFATIFAIMFFGFRVIRTGDVSFIQKPNKMKAVLFSLFKFSLVYYFAVGSAWQDYFYQGVVDASNYAYQRVYEITGVNNREDIFNELALNYAEQNNYCSGDMLHTDFLICLKNLRISSDGTRSCAENDTSCELLDFYHPKFDGCYFAGEEYKAGRKYLAIFDTLDCKLAKYFGYGPQLNVPNLVIFLIAALFASWLGAFLIVIGFLFFFLIIGFVVKALYIFLLSFIAINILIFVSPIIFPTLLFNRTKGIFNAWFTNLMGFVLQPILLLAFVAVFIGVFDDISMGEAVYKHSLDNPHNAVPICSTAYDDEIRDSLVCLFDIDPTSQYHNISDALTSIGINISSLEFDGTLLMEIKYILINLFSFTIIVYIFYSVLGKVTGIAASIFGGKALSGGDLDPMKIAKKTFGVARGAAQITAGSAGQVIKGVKSVGEMGRNIGKVRKARKDAKAERGGKKKKKEPDKKMTGQATSSVPSAPPIPENLRGGGGGGNIPDAPPLPDNLRGGGGGDGNN